MKWKPATTRMTLYIVAAAVLLTGLCCAALIHLSTEPDSGNTLVQNFENSKRYRHDLEVIGGKMNVLMDQFCRWFASLWEGRSLAVTITWLTLVISLGVFLLARHLPSEIGIHGQSEKRPNDVSP